VWHLSFRRRAISDFFRLYVVLVAIPLIPHLLTWARDFDATARKVRFLDHANKLVSFWDNWVKTIATIIPDEEHRSEGTELLVSGATSWARHQLADVGYEVVLFYRSKAEKDLAEFPMSYSEFQIYRAGLPWYRRALLLYKSPNRMARTQKFGFQSILSFWVAFIGFVGLLHLLRGVLHSYRDQILANLPWVTHRIATDVFIDAHPVLFFTALIGYTVASLAYCRQTSIKFENDPSHYVRDRLRRRHFGENHEDPE
jgi:hypothetical protein